MARTLRRLVAGIAVAGSLAALAPQAHASAQCMKTQIAGRYYVICV